MVEIGGKRDCVYSQPVAIECEVVQLGGGRIEVEVIGNDSYDAVGGIVTMASHSTSCDRDRRDWCQSSVCYEQFGVDVNGVKLAVLKA